MAGFSLVEILMAMVVLALAGLVGSAYAARGTADTNWQRDRIFAHQKALSILAELRGLVDDTGDDAAADLDAYDDQGVQSPTLTLSRDPLPPYGLVAPDHKVSGNMRAGSHWMWSRSIDVAMFHETDERSRRLCTVRIYRRMQDEPAPGTLMAEVSGIIRTMEDPLPGGHAYTLYVLAIENVPSPWLSTDAARAFLEGALSDLRSRSPGLQFDVHWITQLGYGRDEEYAPYVNVLADMTADLPWAYVYPGTLPELDERPTLFAPKSMQARYKRDGEVEAYFVNDWGVPESFLDENGNGVADGGEVYSDSDGDGHYTPGNAAPYAFADQFNHAMRAPAARARHAARVADRGPQELTWRLLLDDLIANPAQYHNAMFLNLHGQIVPMPPTRNYSDAARAPETRPGWRVVTHPERLRPVRVAGDDDASEAPRFRVYAYKTAFAGSEKIMTQAEPLVDTNKNGHYDDGETWIDWNGNGVHDAGLPITVVIPGGDFRERINEATTPSLIVRRLVGGVDADGDGSAEAYAPFAVAPHFPEVFIDANGDKIRNVIEPFLDVNGNGLRDENETFVDLDGDGVHSATEETLVDSNGNGTWDIDQPTESFTDSNGNGRWDPAEPYWDMDGDGAWTPPTTPTGTYVAWKPVHFGNPVQEAKYLAEQGEPFLDRDGDGVYDDTAEPLVDLNGNGVHDTGYSRGEMYCTSRYDAGLQATILELHGTPLEAPVDAAGAGLHEDARLYDLEYVPCPTPATAEDSDRFSRTLATVGDMPKNTARWIIEIPTASIRSVLESSVGAGDGDVFDRVLALETRIGTDLTTGVRTPTANQPTNLSTTYAWFCDSAEDVPYSERFQFLGDPRHHPYADSDAEGASFPNGYNWFFDDLQADGDDARSLWPALDGSRLADRWAGRADFDVPRYMAWLRTAFSGAEVFSANLGGLRFEAISLGGEIVSTLPEEGEGVLMSGLPFGLGDTVTENGLYDRGTSSIRGTRKLVQDGRLEDKRIREGGSWWCKPWLGELSPDSAYADQWKVHGNLVAGTGTTADRFRQVRRSAVPASQQPLGTELSDARGELGVLGGTTFFHIGSAGSTFQQGRTPVVGLVLEDGLEVGTTYGTQIPTAVSLSNPYLLDWGGDTQVNGRSVGPAFSDTTTYPRFDAEQATLYYAEGTSSNALLGSSVLRHIDPKDRRSRMAVSSLYEGTEDGAAFLGRYALLSLVNAYTNEGEPGVPNRVRQLPTLSILSPVADATYPAPTALGVRWRVHWARWDRRRYGPDYPVGFEEAESELVYRVLYSWNNGGSWFYMQDGSPAEPGALRRLPDGRPDPRYCVADAGDGDESYTWSTPATSVPDAAYLVRIEAHHKDEANHFSFKMDRFNVSR